MSFDYCTDYKKESLEYNNAIASCFEKNYKMGCIVTTQSLKSYEQTHRNEPFPNKMHRYPINEKDTFLFKSYNYYQMYNKMCRKLHLKNDRIGKNESVLSDILICIFEGVCVFYIANAASCNDSYQDIHDKIVKLISENKLRESYTKQGFNKLLMNDMYVQRMDVRYVFEQISHICKLLYEYMDRSPKLFDPTKMFCRNILLGLKLSPCGQSSPLKFKGSKFVQELGGDSNISRVRRGSEEEKDELLLQEQNGLV